METARLSHPSMRGLCLLLSLFLALPARAEPLDRETTAGLVVPPFLPGEQVSDTGVWRDENAGGITADRVFETEPLLPLPGFSGAAILGFVLWAGAVLRLAVSVRRAAGVRPPNRTRAPLFR